MRLSCLLNSSICGSPDLGWDIKYVRTRTEFPIYIRSATANSWIMKVFIWLKEDDFSTMQRDVHKVISWDFEKWIHCHGVGDTCTNMSKAYLGLMDYAQNVIESNARDTFKEAYGRYL